MSEATEAGSSQHQGDVHNFEADVSRLLHMMVHSVYSDRSIFLRELISNAADACEKLRFEALSHPDWLGSDSEFAIRITIDRDARTLTIADNGIGMNRQDLTKALGTIAHSGTRAFVERQGASKSPQESDAETESDAPSEAGKLIGQFGVGFYSAFIVADTVKVLSRRAGEDESWRWVSDGKGSYSVSRADQTLERGSSVILTLKDGAEEFLERWKLESIIREHSAAIQVPIFLTGAANEEAERITDGRALWNRPKASVTSDEYKEFYREIARQFDDPALTIHWHAEGRYEYSVLAFVPTDRPLDLFDPARKGRSRLYVRRVLISDDADLLPAWLRFVRVVVDAADVPLNISRELVQKSPIVAAIKKAVTNRIVQELANLAKHDASKFATVWSNFGAVIKEGLYEDPEKRDQIFDIARFASTISSEATRSLKDYVADLRPNQTSIFYIAGDNRQQIMASPQLEGFKARGVEVLVLSDPVDSFWTSTALGFDGKPFKSVAHDTTELASIPLIAEDQTAQPEADADFANLAIFAKEILHDQVEDVRASNKLSESPACLVAGQQHMDRRLEKLLADHGRLGDLSKPVLELNAGHGLVKQLSAKLKEDQNRSTIEDAIWLLFDESRLIDGDKPTDGVAFRKRLFRLLAQSLDR